MPVPLKLRLGLALALASHACCAWLGWTLRDRSADRAMANVHAAAQAQRADAAQAARHLDHANARAGAQAESQRVAIQDARDIRFSILQRDITTHAQNPGRDRGDADAEFVRIWRQANAGGTLPP